MVDIFKSIDEMIAINICDLNDEIWVSSDIKDKIGDLKEYKGYKIYSSVLMPNDYMIISKMFYTEE